MNLEVPKYNLDFSKPVLALGNFSYNHNPILKSYIDKSIVQTKFELWQYVAKNKLIQSPDEMVRARAISLLKDKTIFAYSYFMFDNKPFKCRYYQDVLLSDSYDRILYAASNQSGKSICLDIDAATEFLIDHKKGWVGLLVSNSLDQSEYQMGRIKHLLKSAKISYKEEDTTETKTGKKDNSTQISYTFYDKDGITPLYTNLLICCPHTSSALGYPADNLWLDEFEFWDDCDYEHFLYQIAIPRTFETKGKIKIFSNPDGKSKMMYKLWNLKDKKGEYVWHRYNFNYWDKDDATQEGFDKMTHGMTRSKIASTSLALFVDTDVCYFTEEEVLKSYDPNVVMKPDVQVFMFLDVGAKHDQSVLTIGYVDYPDGEQGFPHIYIPIIHVYPVAYPLSRVVGAYSDNQETDGWHYEKSVADYYKEFVADNIYPTLGFDVTGNSGIVPLIETIQIPVQDVVFSGPKKSGYYQRFKYFMEKGLLHRCKSEEFEFQTSHLEMKKSSRGYMSIHHENEDELDDCPDSVAGLIALADPIDEKFAPASLKIIMPYEEDKLKSGVENNGTV
jgi:hypothetical protein